MEELPPMSAVLYPAVEPYESGLLEVSDGQSLYWETVGNPAGIPVLYLHGGPGSGCTVGARRFFDPETFRAVLFDQRGCGRSLPLASGPDVDLTVNTTAHILDDIERLREHLGIERWLVSGLSWGVSLGLVYAQAFPGRVIAMALGAVTGGTRLEIEWITRAMGRIFPREWEEFVVPRPPTPPGTQAGRRAPRTATAPRPDCRPPAPSRPRSCP
ncbi:alpha/beta fold hydrolase [Streptomyces sp. NPDC002130]|uniref:alpha/beta fold hydrolase n=1 Tax=Streptomyces sp. NPDC002130 TaxID=3155568 RepID=UPI00331FF2C8